MGISLAEARPHYEKAFAIGKKQGGSPAVLDEILEKIGLRTPKEIPLGVQDIALEQIVGTKSEGRKNCFSRDFSPLMKTDTEFAGKWISLCRSHLEEGIHDPIKVYEYMNEYYVMEGNKRVSILKYFDSYSIPADVIRILPPLMDRPDILLYYAYLDFYNLTKINYIYFNEAASFTKLQRLVGKQRNESWTDDDRLNFDSVYSRFRMEYIKLIGQQNYRSVCDAFLFFITVVDYERLKDMYSKELSLTLKKLKEEFTSMLTPEPASLQMDPFNKKPNLLMSLVPKAMLSLKVAFIHDTSAERSGWTFNHDAGRRHLEEVFSGTVSSSVYNNTDLTNITETLEAAIREKNQVIFTTSPIFLKETLKAAVEHPEIKFLNCSTHMSYKHVRTYYARMYEIKFLLGAIAGAMTDNDKVGYVADYPIYGVLSNINAFALGAKMVNPRVKVHLKWSKQQYDKNNQPITLEQIYDDFRRNEIRVICDKDSPDLSNYSSRIGLYHVDDKGSIWNMALPLWDWGVFYEKTIANILNGNWKSEEHSQKNKGINYWWGISSGVVNIIHSSRLPIGTVRLINLLKERIIQGDFNPFSGLLFSQDHVIQSDYDATLSPEEILSMDWLAENVIGEIPAKEKLNDKAKTMTEFVGFDKTEHVL